MVKEIVFITSNPGLPEGLTRKRWGRSYEPLPRDGAVDRLGGRNAAPRGGRVTDASQKGRSVAERKEREEQVGVRKTKRVGLRR